MIPTARPDTPLLPCLGFDSSAPINTARAIDARFAGFAKSLMSGSADEQPEPAPDIDPSMLKKISGMLSGKGGTGRDAKLLEAMRPFLSEKRRGKMDRAMKIARLAGIAELAAEKLGGDDDGSV